MLGRYPSEISQKGSKFVSHELKNHADKLALQQNNLEKIPSYVSRIITTDIDTNSNMQQQSAVTEKLIIVASFSGIRICFTLINVMSTV